MKYPRLPDELNLSKKLTSEQIQDLNNDFNNLSSKFKSKRLLLNFLAKKYSVSYHTVYYWTNEKYRNEKRKKNSEYWNKMKTLDYDKWYRHKKQEIARRRNRMDRNPDLKTWHNVVSAKNDKRSKRKTMKGRRLEEY
jgi:hypothetical protein